MIEKLTTDAIALLKKLIETPSFSSEEDETASLIEQWFEKRAIPYTRTKNNVWATNKYFDASKPTLLLNSHHDTVKPNDAYTRDPHSPDIEAGRLYGNRTDDHGKPPREILERVGECPSERDTGGMDP